jgi:glycogen debranching enzyme
VHQNWKDSHDSLHDRDGRSVRGVIAPVEVQGYVYAAYESLAGIVLARGHAGWAAKLRARAERVRSAVETLFWMEDEGYYAQALDGDKRQVRAISSNPGHLLYCGLPSPERAQAVAVRMRRPDLDSGWGIRTLSSAMPSYNPLSYHNGSIWPHDNSLIAAGLRRYGCIDDANRIASVMFAVAETDPLLRLPELYCGFARTNAAAQIAPVPYPVSCSPQAWAAASSQLLVRSMLGLGPVDQQQVAVVDPALPAWLSEVTIHGLTVRGLPAAVTIRRNGQGYDVLTTGPVQ